MLISTTAIVVIVLWALGFAVAMLVKRSPEVLFAGILVGWLFLPQFRLDLPVIKLNKLNLITICAGMAALVIDQRWRPVFKLSVLDLPVLGLCIAAFGASVSNRLGAYDGFVAALQISFIWTLPWFVGRTVFGSPKNFVLLVRYTILAALIYVPFCVFEMKMAPVLHSALYGYAPRGGGSLSVSALRFGLWRPSVFMEFGLQLSLFMGIASTLALWGHWSGAVRHVGRLSTRTVAAVLAVTTVFCVSSGAILLTAIGWALVAFVRLRESRAVLMLLCLMPIVYPIFRMTNPGAIKLEVASLDSELSMRQSSLRTRIVNEDIFIAHWQKRPLLGWTAQRYFAAGADVIPDSLWIQTLCKYGFLGWSCLTAVLLIPPLKVCCEKARMNLGSHPEWILALSVLIFMLDCLMNAMENPIYVVMAGAVVSVAGRASVSESYKSSVPQRDNVKVQRTMWPQRSTVEREP